MRLTNEVEKTTKTITVEEYNTFNGLLKSPKLFYLLIAYTAFIVVNAVLAILDRGYVMGIISLACQGCICAAMWIFRSANLKTNEEKFSTKGTTLFQTAHAVKYVFLFVILVVLLIMIILAWINAGTNANQAISALKGTTQKELLVAAKKAKTATFWKYFGLTIFYLVFMVGVCVYYKAVMCYVDGMVKYQNKGTHCWNDLKFLSIYLFVTAGICVVMDVLIMTGVVEKMFKLVSDVDYSLLTGGLGIFSCIGRLLFAALCVCTGLVLLKGYKTLSTTKTYHEETIEVE